MPLYMDWHDFPEGISAEDLGIGTRPRSSDPGPLRLPLARLPDVVSLATPRSQLRVVSSTVADPGR